MKIADEQSIRRWLLLKTEGDVITCSMNFPEKHNALSRDLIRALTEFFSTKFLALGIRAVVLRGEGPSFCAGADINYMKAMANFSREENIADAEMLSLLFETILACEVPVIGLAHGNVYGGGVGLLAACDIPLATDDTKFCFSEVKLGLAPAVISPVVLSRIGHTAGRRLFLTGEIFSAPQAQAMNLVCEVGPAAEIEVRLQQILKYLLAAGPQAGNSIKLMLNRHYALTAETFSEKKKYLTNLIADLRVSPEGQEGMSAFFEKRKPNWVK